jgi:hypothetical protein
MVFVLYAECHYAECLYAECCAALIYDTQHNAYYAAALSIMFNL